MDPSRPPKVVLLVSSYPRSAEDSASVFLRRLAHSLSRRGIAVHVLAPAEKKGGAAVEDGVTIHRFPYLPEALQRLAYGSGILSNLERNRWLWMEVPFFVFMMTYALLRLVREIRPHLIHAHWVLPQGLIALSAKLLYKIPVVTTAHGADAFALKGPVLSWLKRFALRRSNAWSANTKPTAEAVDRSRSVPQPHIIPMGVNFERFENGRRTGLRREIGEGELLVLFVGRLVEKKGVDDLLKALSLLPAELIQRTNLWIVGDGDHRAGLEEETKALGLEEKVRFWGGIDNDRLPEFYGSADLFVAPSVEARSGDTEGQGIVILEASASRVCVLATRVGGIPEVIEDKRTGILVEPRDPRALAEAMARLLADPKIRAELAENAFLKVKSDYTWEKVARDFEALYRSVIQSC